MSLEAGDLPTSCLSAHPPAVPPFPLCLLFNGSPPALTTGVLDASPCCHLRDLPVPFSFIFNFSSSVHDFPSTCKQGQVSNSQSSLPLSLSLPPTTTFSFLRKHLKPSLCLSTHGDVLSPSQNRPELLPPRPLRTSPHVQRMCPALRWLIFLLWVIFLSSAFSF